MAGPAFQERRAQPSPYSSQGPDRHRKSTARGTFPCQLSARAALIKRITTGLARDEAKARGGDTFSLKDFHTKALSLGAMGLDPLREALARFSGTLTT